MQTFAEIPSDSANLAASLHRPVDARRTPVVICCHGLTGTRIGSSYRLVTIARQLAEAGIACLRFDFRGCGESDGAFQDVTTDTLLSDLYAVLDWLFAHPDLDASRIGLIASSFGAYTAARAVERMPGLKGCVFFAPVADPDELIQRDMSDAAWALLRKQGWIDHHGHRLGIGFFESLSRDDVPAQFAKSARPLRVYHGADDQQVPITHGERYVNASRESGAVAELVSLPTGDHGMKGVPHTEQIITGSIEWMRQWL